MQQKILNRLDTIEKVLKRRHSFPHQSREAPTPTSSHVSDHHHGLGMGQATYPSYTEQVSFDDYPNTQPSTYDPPNESVPHHNESVPHHQSPGSTGRAGELFTSWNREQEQHITHGPEPFPIKFIGHSLPSSDIEKEKLQDPSTVLAKYPKLRCESRIATLAVKLAKDSFFGVKTLSKCTVMGERELPGLPRAELLELKKLLFLQFPNFWNSKQQFEPIWKQCIDAVGQLCKRERCKGTVKEF